MSFLKFSSVGGRGLMVLAKKEPRMVIQTIKKLWYFYLKNFIPDGMINGHSNYTKFIVVSKARTGSNFLRGSLMTHSRMVVFGDLFRRYNVDKRDPIIPWGFPYYPQTKKIQTLFQNEPIKFLETEVFERVPKKISAVGFKSIYPAAYPESWEPILTYLKNQKAFKIIHIKRKNILKTHLSFKKTRMVYDNSRFVNLDGTQEHNVSISLDYEECLNTFINTRKQEEEQDNFFKDHNKVEVLYENLFSNYEHEMKRIQEFLDVDYEAVKPLTLKQSSQPLSSAISNYAALKEKFKGTEWEEFFED